VNYVRNLLEQIGLGGERVRMVNLSAAMAAAFAKIVTEMVEKIRKLGPNPLGAYYGTGGHEGDHDDSNGR